MKLFILDYEKKRTKIGKRDGKKRIENDEQEA